MLPWTQHRQTATLPVPAKAETAESFERIMRKYNALVFRTARAVLNSAAEAEDCAQQVWLKVHHRLESYTGQASFAAWIGKIAYHEAISMRRSQFPDKIEAAPPNLEFTGISPEGQTLDSELRAAIESAVDQLPSALREVFVLRDVDGRAAREVAYMLDLTEENVRIRSHRARTLLRRWLTGLEDDTSYGAVHTFDGARCDRIVNNVLSQLFSGSIEPH